MCAAHCSLWSILIDEMCLLTIIIITIIYRNCTRTVLIFLLLRANVFLLANNTVRCEQVLLL